VKRAESVVSRLWLCKGLIYIIPFSMTWLHVVGWMMLAIIAGLVVLCIAVEIMEARRCDRLALEMRGHVNRE